MKYIPRLLEKHIKYVLFKGKIVIIYGPRQVGKTSMVRQIITEYPDTAYYSCENPDIKQKLQNKNSKDLGNFVQGFKLVVFDEAQAVENIGITLKLLHDAYPEVQIIATGSSSFELANKIKEPLTGRSLEYTLWPMSFKELADAEGVIAAEQLVNTCLTYGSYPGILFGQLNRQELLSAITTQYLYKDLLSFQGIRMPALLERLVKVLAVSVGNEVSMQELSNTLDVSRTTVEAYLKLLEQAFVIFRLSPFSGNIRSQLTKKQKIYFVDVGIRNAVLGTYSDIDLRPDKGAVWENYVIAERKKILNISYNWAGKQYFLRTYDGQEIDLIEEWVGPQLRAFEIKFQSPKKYKTPAVWSQKYPEAPVNIISRENIAEVLNNYD